MTTGADNLLAATEVVADEVVAMHSTEPKETSSGMKAPDLVSTVAEEKHATDIGASEAIVVSVVEVADETPDVANEQPEAEVEDEAESAKVVEVVVVDDGISEAEPETMPIETVDVAEEVVIEVLAPVVPAEAAVAVVVSEEAQKLEPEPETPVVSADTDAGDVAEPEPVDVAIQSKSVVVDAAKSNDTSQDGQPDSDAEQPIPDSAKRSVEDDPPHQKDDKEEEEAPYERPRVQVYGSTVSGNRVYKRQAKELFTMLEAQEVDFEFICIAADEQAKKYLRRKALGNMTIPQVYVDGELRGFYDDAFKANEADELYEWLRLDEEPDDY
ncbi:hypothetical protein IWW39_003947 [Coemansia spiralis]|uniref:Glutaredoxin domain-containing protein n=1 Tax=Coemansia spiralis TaxID=417178 RepID=A0A9W8GHD7_9FUNG|nr:hypothetical protein IWW39_003947 [Coemansia spiralis]